jgi:peptidoglycan/xylan/chitin deacetylase (PgdA/CDA1 family)
MNIDWKNNINTYESLRQNKDIWDLFTRKEEYNTTICDKFGRFPSYASRENNILEPMASKYLIDHKLQVEYPDGKPFAVCLTHDIDWVYKPLLAKFFYALRSVKARKINYAFQSLNQMQSPRLPWWNFNKIIALEKSYGAKSSFYFLALKRGDRDYSYDISDLGQDICSISDEGWEVGLHGGYNSYYNEKELQIQKNRLENILNKKVIGYRNHFLGFKVPDTWEILGRAGFRYDATFGYADYVGFRNGMCHPFRPFNLNTNRYIDIWEIPLAIMDTTLYNYMKLDTIRSWEFMKRLIDNVERNRGVITILWHNTSMADDKLILYEKILKYCLNKNAWMSSGQEIWNWWEKYYPKPNWE